MCSYLGEVTCGGGGEEGVESGWETGQWEARKALHQKIFQNFASKNISKFCKTVNSESRKKNQYKVLHHSWLSRNLGKLSDCLCHWQCQSHCESKSSKTEISFGIESVLHKNFGGIGKSIPADDAVPLHCKSLSLRVQIFQSVIVIVIPHLWKWGVWLVTTPTRAPGPFLIPQEFPSQAGFAGVWPTWGNAPSPRKGKMSCLVADACGGDEPAVVGVKYLQKITVFPITL